MSEAFRLGGWGMYPTLIAGLALGLTAFTYAARPDPRRRQIVKALAMLTFLVSCLGFTAGVIRTFLHAADADLGDLVIGVGESLHNLGLGLMLLVLAGIGTAIGTFRTGAPRDAGAGATDLHGV